MFGPSEDRAARREAVARDSKSRNPSRATSSDQARGAGKSERLGLRVTPDIKAQIEQAASLSGLSVSTFVLDATVRRALNGTLERRTSRIARGDS